LPEQIEQTSCDVISGVSHGPITNCCHPLQILTQRSGEALNDFLPWQVHQSPRTY
jgi:hypothetical protein